MGDDLHSIVNAGKDSGEGSLEKIMSAFRADASSLGILLSDKQLQQYLQYYQLLIEWNQRFNLTAITDPSGVFKKHFIDSLTLVKAVSSLSNTESSFFSLIDVGTGAGFPGIPLKIAFPGLYVVLLDSLQKRVRFLEEVIATLGLSGIRAVHGRAEDLARLKQHRDGYDICVSRAVANLAVLSEYCLPYVKIGGMFVAYKTVGVSEEIDAARNAVSILGGRMENLISFQLPDSDVGRSLIVIDKVRPTPAKYPRKAGMPGKDPLH